MKTPRIGLIILLLVLLTGSGCLQPSGQEAADTKAPYDTTITPPEGQPAFPKLGKYWVVDPENACHFSVRTLEMADTTFEALRKDHISEVAVVCQKGVKNNGPTNDAKIWLMRWGRYVRLGDANDRRALVWLIQPDIPDNRVTIELGTWLTWYTAIDYTPGLEEAGNYANFGDYNGALESIVRTTNENLRRIWKEHHQ